MGPELRWEMEEIMGLIQARRYCLLHAPRQTGKTSSLLHLRDKLNAEGHYAAVYCNIEAGQAARNDVKHGMLPMIQRLLSELRFTLGIFTTPDEQAPYLQGDLAFGGIANVLEAASAKLWPRPLVVFFDEVDALIGDTLLSFLRQIRSGYAGRPKTFPQSVFLCGLRDLADYRIKNSSDEIITGGNAFNIKAKSLKLGDFTRPMVEALLTQHTESTGQEFTLGARESIWNLTNGQPWLVNALA